MFPIIPLLHLHPPQGRIFIPQDKSPGWICAGLMEKLKDPTIFVLNPLVIFLADSDHFGWLNNKK